ncbi:unnamed protein product [Acanthoscelides obtectus]|nr:unnamed protein product [Acanthoscelides obtectus]CAK1679319.1 Nose resistant to fluoxetine protein 6 [Acanthoscelides obtectus]
MTNVPPVFHQDNYDDCNLDKGLYCSFTYAVKPIQENGTTLWRTIKELSSNPYNYRHDILRHSICVTKSCPGVNPKSSQLLEEIKVCYDQKYNSLGISGSISNLKCEGISSEYPVDGVDIFVAYVFFIYMGFIFIATLLYSICDLRKIFGRRVGPIIEAFAIMKNWNRLKTITPSPDVERLRSIQGIRFYNMVLVILTHVVLFSLMGPIANTTETENLTSRWTTVFLASGPLCVSTFFMISSWLLIHGLLDAFKHKKEISFKVLILAFVNRYIRLTPTLAAIIAFQASWLRHFGDGPNWNHHVGEEFIRCRKNWWTNLLYIHNFVDPGNMCMQTTWYLALDSQYFPVLLLTVWCIKKYPKMRWPLLGGLTVLSILVTFYENYTNRFPALLMPTPESLYGINHTLKNMQWHIQYIGLFGNLAGPLVGLYFGYIYHNKRDTKLFVSKISKWVWWLVVHVACYGIIIIPGIFSLDINKEHSPFWASMHAATARLVFAAGIGFGLFGLSQRVECYLKRVLEWPPTYVLGRLTYSAYLVHIPVLLFKIGVSRSPTFFNEFLIFLDLGGTLVATYMAALVLTIGIEMPTSQLLKLALVDTTDVSNKKK